MKKDRLFLGLIFFIGFISLIYEIYGTRVLFFFLTETDWAITVGITAFLAGIAVSSLFFSSLSKKRFDAVTIIWFMQIAAGLYGYFFLQHYTVIPQIANQIVLRVTLPLAATLLKIALMWLFLFVPAFFIGGSFPLINELVTKNSKTAATGLVYFWDTIGSLVGGLVTGFFLLPYCGFVATCLLAVSLNFGLAIFIGPKPIYKIISATALGLVILTFLWNSKSQRVAYLNDPVLAARFGTVLFQKVSPYGVVTIGQDVFGMPGNKALFINYRDMCFSQDHNSESAIGSLTVQELPTHARVLNIGLGCGFTAQSIAFQPTTDHLDIVEINPVVAEATSQFFKDENNDVTHSPKTNLIIADGAEFVRTTKNKYDGVVIDIEEPTIIDSSPLFTSEYIDIIHQTLNPGGMLTLWMPKANDQVQKIMFNTLKANFAHVYIHVFGEYFTFYATDLAKTDLLPTTPEQISKVERILKTNNAEINTLDQRVLEKYYDLKSTFSFPTNYQDPQEK